MKSAKILREKVGSDSTLPGKIGDCPTLEERGYHFLCITEPTSFQHTQLTELNKSVQGGPHLRKNKFVTLYHSRGEK